MIKRTCPNCGITYEADPGRLKHGRQTTCSRKCSYELRAKNSQVNIEYTCDWCKKTFIRKPFQMRAENVTVCSFECYNSIRSGGLPPFEKQDTCKVCGKQFTRAGKRTQKHCSRKCFEISHKENMKGEANPSYVDGRSKNRRWYRGDDWDDIRKDVYKRDNYTCQNCGVKCIPKSRATSKTSHKIIQCHHIIPYKKGGSNDLSNLVTICVRCHGTIESSAIISKQSPSNSL